MWKGPVLAVQVLPPFYSTWWFRLLSALIIAALIYLIWRQRTTSPMETAGRDPTESLFP